MMATARRWTSAVVAEHAEDERDKHDDLGDSALMHAGTAAGSAMQVLAR
jgi:hypothetical protein